MVIKRFTLKEIIKFDNLYKYAGRIQQRYQLVQLFKNYMLYNITPRPIGAREGDQRGILRFTMELFVYKLFLLVIRAITNRNNIYLLPFVN